MSVSWLVIGVGDITTKRVLPAILADPNSRLAGIVTRTPAKAVPYGVPAWQTLESALGACDANAVYVASPVALHAPHTLGALRAGRHVLCEKPVAMNYVEASTMRDGAEWSGRTVGVAYYRRTYPKIQRVRELLRSGAIGQPVYAEITCHSAVPARDDHREWLLDPALAGGGPLYDIGSHRIDLLNFLLGAPRRVTGQMSNAVHQLAVEDCATVMIEYESGARGVVDVRWHTSEDRDEFRLTGTRGTIELSPLNGPRLAYPGGEERLPVHANLHYPCVADFSRAVIEGRPPVAPIGEAILTDWVTGEVMRQNGRWMPQADPLQSVS